ncbi:CaiB/BaiF CoA transferase family protein [Piscinibacter sakaiensis]|uniref:Alpha-methylacyl-CoA racemase n=1 Tax=Piscinibacter sakaiensis TaxID=1547922 RepID=A0A0K8P880_PISS1|nr:CaiB/BaiF CoA-transferase family protein [Piscinibacter sakaiensis]GAP38842.1 alpha-methylacyl-CoA racemase [Piscinibacter sakaiensis]
MTAPVGPGSGPLAGLRVVELAGLGPAPFCAMLLADLGAEVLRVLRPGTRPDEDPTDLGRNRSNLVVDLRRPEGVALVLDLVAGAEALIEGFRPGVTERLGLGPEACLARQPALVYGRMTGWGQHGPLAQAAGHDLNYIAISGVLHAVGEAARPVPPLNLVGDFGGGGLLLAFGLVCALLEARRSGQGQVVDAAMTDGAALLSAMMFNFKAAGRWSNRRADNLLDGGAPFYGTYACADGRFVAIGPLEPAFWAEFRRRCGLDGDPLFDRPHERSRWPAMRARLEALFASRSRDDWCALLEGSDACVAPVLDWDEAVAHPHNRARGTHVEVGGHLQPAPAPRFSRTPAAQPQPGRSPAPAELLAGWGIEAGRCAALQAAGVVGRVGDGPARPGVAG